MGQTFGIPKQEAPKAHTPSIRCDVHPAQFHRIRRDAFESEHAGEMPVADGDHEAPIALGVIRLDAIDLLGERPFDIALERVVHAVWRKRSVHRDEQRPHPRVVAGHIGAKLVQLPRSLGLMKT